MTELENEFMRFWIDDEILYSEFKFPLGMDLDKIKKLIETRHAISGTDKQYWCYDVAGGKEFSKECRDYVDIYGQELLHACALVIDSHIQKFLFNTYMKLKKPNIPFQVFTNRTKAVTWLREMKEKNENL